MKKLKRMLLVNWHNYAKEVIEFDTINFLTGKTAAGKSTIIDALQLVLLGDTTGSFFNKAANQKSARTLKGYLFGETGDDGETGFNYLRNERFTSYVALEFEDTTQRRMFTTGIVCDCYKDQTFDYKWFILNNRGLPENLFVDEKSRVPYDIRNLRALLAEWLKGKKGYDFELLDTNKRYQEVTLGKFGQVKNKYRVLLKKAVPFSPIADIEQFITESICDIKDRIDVDQMQSDIRQYKQLEQDALGIQERITKLQEICSINKNYENEKEKFKQQDYIFIRAGKAEAERQENEINNLILEKRESIMLNEEAMKNLKSELSIIIKKLEQLEIEYRTSDIAKRERELKEGIAKIRKEINELEKSIQAMLERINGYGKKWLVLSDNLKSCGFSTEIVEEGQLLFAEMKDLDVKEAKSYPFVDVAIKFDNLKSEVNGYQAELKKRGEQLKHDIEELEGKISNINKGIKPYPYEVTSLKRIIEEQLFKLHKKAVPVYILADLLEIPEPRWRNAIEGYLDKQKFYLLVNEEYYRDSLRIYSQEKEEKKIHDVGLIDIGKLKKYTRPLRSGSLAEEVESDNKCGKLYANYLLGGVMKCDHVDDLRNHKIAITDDGMLYKGFVSRRINPARYSNPFIGRKSLELLIIKLEKDLEQQKKLYEEVINYHRIVKDASSAMTLSRYEGEENEKLIKEAGIIPQLKERLLKIQQEYDGLDILFLERMEKKIVMYKEEIKEKDGQKHELDKDNTRLDTEIENMEKEKLPEIKRKVLQIQGEIDEEFELDWIEKVGEPRFLRESAANRTMASLKSGFYSAKQQTAKKRDSLRSQRTEKRSRYNGEYKMPFDIEAESNRDFDKELQDLDDIRLPEYIEKIKDSKVKAYNQFRDDFIAKLKSNIETVTEQLNELNASLKQSVFGTDTYRFEKKPRPEYRAYYDMIMDPLLMDTSGWNISSKSFNEKYKKEIDELFRLLILNDNNVSAERRSEYERNIKKFTDYKTYLIFDLVVTNEQGDEQRLSKTLLKKSGGETQIPFYIALLASFSQVCRIRSKKHNNTIRLIILDEAFSKMDGERIQESIRLLKRFELQAIFSAPPDKIPDIAPLVSRNIAVYKGRKHSFTKNFDPKEIDEVLMEE
ncbi:AAA family ATPase [Alkalicella caledoniensis]|uniref:AAA family ATPase n=1 Tax=Alkalicella caledoniensis TaxID=2731377 RepID=A0A7G9WB69_ALKCA|nr:SbcC/MukB-like Walker B domain-containing protein [Alkalicella caledoniensis]QNO15931.1 AAA family ATPase [Alkalicella caledoniensis]